MPIPLISRGHGEAVAAGRQARACDGVSLLRRSLVRPCASPGSRDTRRRRVGSSTRHCVRRRRSGPHPGWRSGPWAGRPCASATSPARARDGLGVAEASPQSRPTTSPDRTTRFRDPEEPPRSHHLRCRGPIGALHEVSPGDGIPGHRAWNACRPRSARRRSGDRAMTGFAPAPLVGFGGGLVVAGMIAVLVGCQRRIGHDRGP
jgi:hypothetical protein